MAEIQRLGSGTVQAVAECADACAEVCNALLNADWEEGDDWDIISSEGNMKFVHPKIPDGDGDGGSGAALGPVVFAGTASGALAYFLVNCDGVAYSAPPTKSDGTPYPIANPP